MKIAFRVAAALVVVALAVAAIVHTPIVRRYALRRAVATLQDQFRIRLHADDLSYNVLALRVSLRGVRVAAEAAPEDPFFTAAQVTAEIPQSALLGPFAIESVHIEGGRLRVARDAAGRTNLPASGDDGAGAPDALRLGSLEARALAVEIVDTAQRARLALPSIDLALSPASGQIELRAPGEVARGDVSTRVHALRGGIAFDGRTIRLSQVALRADELAATIDGTLAVLVHEPRADVRVIVNGDVARLARWAGLASPPRGSIQVRGDVTGPFAAPVASMTFASQRLAWDDATLTDVTGAARMSADVVEIRRLEAHTAGGRIEASGLLPLGAGDTLVKARWAGVDVETLASMSGVSPGLRPTGRTMGTIEARGPGVDVQGWTIDAAAESGGGETARNRVAVEGRVNVRVRRGEWQLETPAPLSVGGLRIAPLVGGRLDLDVLARSTIGGRVELLPTPVRDLTDLVRRTGIAAIDVAAPDGTIEAAADIAGTFGRPAIDVAGAAEIADLAAVAPGTALGGPAYARFESDLHTAHVKASVPELVAFAEATVDLQPPYVATLDVVAAGLAIERALRGVEAPVAVTGTFTASAHATGPLERWRDARADVRIDALDARVGALPVQLVSPARASIAAQVVDVVSLEISAGEARISASGRLPLTDAAAAVSEAGALQVTATGDVAQFLNAAAATGLAAVPDLAGSGPAALLARITGSAQQPRIAGDLELGPGTLRAGDLPAVTNVTLRMHADGKRIELRSLGAEWQGSRVDAEGQVPFAWTGLDIPARGAEGTLTARVTAITPRVLEPFVEQDTLEQIAGSIDATLHLRSPSPELADVRGELRLDRMELRIADLPIAQREPTRVAIRDGFAEIESWQWMGQGATAGVQGRVRLSDRQTALLADGRFDLRMLTPFTRDAGATVAGSLQPRLSITGTLDSPRIDGVASLAGGEVRLADPRVIATDLDGRLVLTGSRAQLTTLSGSVNGGTLSGRGALDFAPRQPLDATLDLEVDGMALEVPEGLHSELDAVLAIAVTVPAADVVEPAGRVSGSVTIVRGGYREPIGVATGVLAALRTRRLASDAAGAEPSLVDNLVLDVRVSTGDEGIVVDNNVGRLQLGADLRLIGTVAAPALSGRAELAGGGELFLGRNRYRIESGTIDFANPDAIEPVMNITATTRAGGEEIQLTIAGTPDSPEIDASSTSDPDLGKAEVISLLLTGRRLEEISGDEAEIVGEQALAYLSGDILAFAGRAVGLDTIRLGGVDAAQSGDPFAIASEVDPTARLTFGKSIGRDIDVVFSQGLRDGDAQTWIVDYRPRRQVEVRFVSDDEDLRSYEFRHDVSFGGGSLSDAPVAREARRTPRVASVVVAGARVLPEERLRSVLRLEPGDVFEVGAWQDDRDRLDALLRDEGFCEGRVSPRRDGDADVVLTYAIVEGPRCVLEVSGRALDEETLAAVRRAWAGAVFDQFLIEEVQAIVRSRLAREGYLQASVEAAISADGDRKVLGIRIDPGARVAATVVRFEGAGSLEAALREWASGREAGLEAAQDPSAFERAVTAWLRARGHPRARVTVGVPLVQGAEAVVPITVNAGPAFTVAQVRLDGARAFDEDMLRAAIAIAPGAPFDPVLVDAARDRLQAHYRRAGFSAARVETSPAIDEATAAVTVTFQVTEGPRQVLHDVQVSGNRATNPDVIARALDLEIGQPVGVDDWLQARRRLFDTGLFRRADVTPQPIEDAPRGDADVPMRARVVVQEWPALRLRYGFQVAEERPEGEVEGRDLEPGLSADVTRRTLFGRAVTLGAAVTYQRRERGARGFISSRSLFGQPVESSFLVERSREEFTSATLVSDITAASWEQRVRAWRDLQLSYAYRFERNRTFVTSPVPDDEFAFDLVVNLAWLNGAVAWDTRDDVADTRRGWLLSSSFDWAPAGLGTDFRFLKYLGQAYYFRPWRGVVLASAARLGAAAALGGQDLVPSERFLAGGSRTVRGVREDALGPRTALGDPAGGESLLVLNQEVRFPIYRWLRGVGFVDAGNVVAETSGIDPGDLVASYGAGLRLATPFALFRVDYGRLFSPRPGERPGRWMFGIGQTF